MKIFLLLRLLEHLPLISAIFGGEYGAKYLGFFSSRSFKTRGKYISFPKFLYFLREVCLLSSLQKYKN
jgi:hypothetical protein